MINNLKREDIVGVECRFAVHCPMPQNERRDLHVVKQVIHTKDGHKIPHIRLIWDYQRSFYVTNKGAQNHQQKKEWELLSNLKEYKTTQTKLIQSIANAVGEPYFRGSLRMLCRNPYIYGADIKSTALIKHDYAVRYPNLTTKYSVACFDVETNVLDGSDDIIMATLSFGSRVITAVDARFVQGHANPEQKVMERMHKYLGQYVEKRKINYEIVFVDSEVKIIEACFKRAHEWKPDFVAIWNIMFDMKRVLRALEKAGIDPKDIFSDPSVPYEYRFFNFKEGSKQKLTASGKYSPVKPSAQWHVVQCPSSFYFIDAMCSYKQIRTGEPEEQSYSLNAILNQNLGIRKLSFKECELLSGIEWHAEMQSRYPFEYIVYNVFDCISMEELDEKTNDLSISLPSMAKFSDFENFKSQPRRLVDDLHFVCLENGYAIATTSNEMTVEEDDDVLDLHDWIVTLKAFLVADNGLRVIEENKNISTNIRGHVGDLDVKAAYPTNETVFNISKETTATELCSIEGIPEEIHRAQGINLSAGHTNAVEFTTVMFKAPSLDTLLEAYKQNKNKII